MSKDKISKHLKVDPADPVIVPGMAHFPGGGPAGMHCLDCDHLVDIPYGMYDKKKKGCCRKFQQIRSDHGATIGGLAGNRACKYFEPKVKHGADA